MDYNQFKKLLENGEISKRESINLLLEFVSEFPYFQTAQAMLAKAMHEQQHVRFERQLKTAAAYSGDRTSLFNSIHPGDPKIIKEKPEIIERIEIPKFVLAEDKTKKIFTDEKEQSAPPAEEIIEEDILEESEVHSQRIEIAAPVVYYGDDMNYGEMEPEEDYDEPKAADPHEIIRRRLNEILGFNEELNKNKKTDLIEVEPAVKSIENTEPIKAVENTSNDQNSLVASKEEIKELSASEIEEKADGTASSFIDRLTKESKKAVDDIDKGELEYALEATLIRSLEDLPIIEKSEPEIEISSKEEKLPEPGPDELTFYEWLKYKSNSEYGKVEEIHAYDPIFIEENREEENINEITAEVQIIPLTIETPKPKYVELIDRFIESDPKIVPSRAEFYSPVNQAKKSITENEDIVSETLARIYQQQGNLLKARSTYEKLSLLYPEKMPYFAALISEIDKEINNLNKENL